MSQLASITDSFFALDRDLRFTYVNSEAQRVLRKTSAEIHGGYLADLFPRAEAFLAKYEQVLATEKPAHFEEFYVPLQIWFEVHAYPSPEGVSVYFRDVTPRKRTEDALRRTEALYRTIACSIPDGAISVVDRELRYVTVEGELLARLGFSKETMVRRTVQEVFAGDTGRIRTEQFRRALAGETTSWETEYHGRTVWTQFVPLRDEHGEVSAAMSLALDTTERKQAEEQLKRQTRHLQLLHQASAQLLVGQHPVALLRQLHSQIAQVFGADAFMLYQANPSNGHLHLLACGGVNEEQQHKLERLRFGRAICVRPEEALHPIIATEIQTRQAPNRRFVRKLGFCSYLYYPLILNNHLHGTVAFASRTRDDYDRTDLDFFQTIAGTLAEALERERLENELQRRAATLERTVQERTAKLADTVAELEGFSYSLVHDMRAPLRAMLAYAGILELEAGERFDPEHADLLRKIKLAALRMDQLVTDSLNYSKILRQDLPLGPVELGTLIRGMVETYPNLQPPNADIRLELPDLVIHGNPAALTQIFSNLLGNAVKFVAPGVHPRVRVWVQQGRRDTESPHSRGPHSGLVRIWVEDNGIGIPKDQQERIFGMFQRLHRANEYPGTGVGLALVRKCLDRTVGQIWLDSEPGKGSRFCVELPLPPPPQTAAAVPAGA